VFPFPDRDFADPKFGCQIDLPYPKRLPKPCYVAAAERRRLRPVKAIQSQPQKGPLSRRIRTLQGILDKLDPPPVCEPLPPLKVYAPPRAKSSQRRGRRKRRSLGCLLVEWRVNHFLSARFAPRRSCSCQTQTGYEDSYR
jgi:hypothetical protein